MVAMKNEEIKREIIKNVGRLRELKFFLDI
jgi:hypothetical protein